MNIGRGYKNYGLCLQTNGDILFKEWAPLAKSMSLFGDFNDWNRGEFRCEKNEFGCFTTCVKANPDGTPRIKHNTKYKIQIEGENGTTMDRNSAWATYQV
jgi:1,4-alpha-glucan branching enzyme